MSGEELWHFTCGRADTTPVVDALSEVWQMDIVLNGTEAMGAGDTMGEDCPSLCLHLLTSKKIVDLIS